MILQSLVQRRRQVRDGARHDMREPSKAHPSIQLYKAMNALQPAIKPGADECLAAWQASHAWQT
jgi:hypothetical protein